MARIFRSAGHGLLAAGLFLLGMHLLPRGPGAFYEAVHPLALFTYLIIFLPFAPAPFSIGWAIISRSEVKRPLATQRQAVMS